MTETIDTRYRLRETRLYGERLLVADIEIPDDAPEELKEGIARRTLVNQGHVCPCGARIKRPDRAALRRAARNGGMVPGTVQHQPDCSALLRGWVLFDEGPWSE